jgi:hypothetical protein
MNTTKEYLLSRCSFLLSPDGRPGRKSYRFLLFKQASICYNKAIRKNISREVPAASRRYSWLRILKEGFGCQKANFLYAKAVATW